MSLATISGEAHNNIMKYTIYRYLYLEKFCEHRFRTKIRKKLKQKIPITGNSASIFEAI